MSQQICKFFQAGQCRFGDNCRNLHTTSGGNQFGSTGFGGNNNRFGSSNSFGALAGNNTNSFGGGGGFSNNNNNNNRGFGGGGGGFGGGANTGFGGNNNTNAGGERKNPIAFDVNTIGTDLTTDRPLHQFSVYGPGKEEPCMITGTDLSQEELRLMYVEAIRYPQLSTITGGYGLGPPQPNMNGQQLFMNKLQQITSKMDQEVMNINNNRTAALDHFMKNVRTGNVAPGMGGMGGGGGGVNPGSTSAFGSAFGGGTSSTNSGFGQTAFGGAAAGAAPTSAFGQTAFGGAATGGPTSAFGQTAFGGAAATPAVTNAFGGTASNVFGAGGGDTTSAFGQTAFGGAAAAAPQSAFGQTAFGGAGAAPGAATGGSVFGQTGFGGAAAGPTTSSAFGQQAQQAPTAFGQTAFGNAAAPTAPVFGQQQQQQQSAFGSGVPSSTLQVPAATATVAPRTVSEATKNMIRKQGLVSAGRGQPLSEQEMEAYRAPQFELKRIPEQEPPQELCIRP